MTSISTGVPPVSSTFQSKIDPGAKATEVAEQFEALFLPKLLEPLQDNEAMFGKGAEARTFSGMFRDNLAKEMAKSRPLGIATQIEDAINAQRGPKTAPQNAHQSTSQKALQFAPQNALQIAPQKTPEGARDEFIKSI
mgnify:CR=1 FL=1